MTDLEKTTDQTENLGNPTSMPTDDDFGFDLSMQEDSQDPNYLKNPFGEPESTDSLEKENHEANDSVTVQENHEVDDSTTLQDNHEVDDSVTVQENHEVDDSATLQGNHEVDDSVTLQDNHEIEDKLNGGNENDNFTLKEEPSIGDVNDSIKDETLNKTSMNDAGLKIDGNKDLDNSLTKEPDDGIVLGKFDNKMIDSDNNKGTGVSTGLNTELLEHPAVLEGYNSNSSVFGENTQDQGKGKLTQKEKLVQLIKIHESKAKKSGFTKGILSGFLLTLGILVVSFVFAKDQIINILNDLGNSSVLASITNLVNKGESSDSLGDEKDIIIDDEILDNEDADDDEILDNEDVVDDEILDNEDVVDDEILDNEDVLDDEILDDENVIDDEILDDENVIDDEILDDENVVDDEILDDEDVVDDEILDDEDVVDDETLNDEDDDNKGYSLVHVKSEDEANWVLPAHCKDLTCYGEDKEFTPCTKFKMVETLDENANRIGSNGACRYKDPSELVYVEFE